MKQKFESILKSVFSISGIIAISGGFFIFLMFCIALIRGGAAGEGLAIYAKSVVMPYFIQSATVATMAGLLMFYCTGNHELSIENGKESIETTQEIA